MKKAFNLILLFSLAISSISMKNYENSNSHLPPRYLGLQYYGQNCAQLAIETYDYWIHSEIDNETAFTESMEIYIECLSQN